MSRSKCPTCSAVSSTRPVAVPHAGARHAAPVDARTLLSGHQADVPYRRCPAPFHARRAPLPRGPAQQPRAGCSPRAAARTCHRGARPGRPRPRRGRTGSTPTLYAALTQRRLGEPLEPPARGRRGRPRRHARRPLDRHRLRQVPRLPPARALRRRGRVRRPGRAGRDRAVSGADQGARRRPARPPRPRSPCRGCGPRLRRRHPARGAAVGPRPRQLRPHQPRPAPSLPPARATSAGRRSCGRCGTSSSTSATSTGGCSGRTWRRCCAGCGGCARGTAPRRRSSSPRRRWPTRRSTRAGSSVCRSRPSPRTARHAGR